MSNYKITKYTYEKARELGLTVKVSKFALKKLDVYKDNVYLSSIGDSKYNDYSRYLEIYGPIFADRRRELYHNRHKKNSDVKYSKQWLALNLLW